MNYVSKNAKEMYFWTHIIGPIAPSKSAPIKFFLFSIRKKTREEKIVCRENINSLHRQLSGNDMPIWIYGLGFFAEVT